MAGNFKLAIITTHPIQYNAPWFKLLATSGFVKPKVFYTWSQVETQEKFDPGFGRVVEWDVPLLEGYEYCFVKNVSTKPGSNHFKGMDNPTLIDEVERWGADAVLVFGWAFKSHLKCIRYFHKKKPVLFRGDSTLLDEASGLKIFLRRFFLKWVYRHVDVALYVGENNKQYFLQHGIPLSKLKYAPHAIDNSRFFDSDGSYTLEAKRKRVAFNFTDDDVVLLFAGKLEPKKNPFFLIELLKKIDHPRLKVLFVGKGLLENELKVAAEKDTRIYFAGFQNQTSMPVFYRMADLFILPSTGPGETWGLALNEAMACGRAIVATNKAGGATDLIRIGKNGFIIYDNDTGHLENFLSKVIDNKSLLGTMGKHSLEIVRDFNFENIVTPVVEVCRALAKQGEKA